MKKLIALLLMLVMAFSISACSESSGTVVKESDKDGQNNTTETTTEAEDTFAKLGETLNYEGLKIKLDEVYEYVDNEEYQLDKPSEGKKFIVLMFTVTNETSKDEYINMFYEDSYCDDVAIDPVSLLFNIKADTIWGDVAVGKQRIGYVAYEVPENWKTIEFIYSPNLSKTKMTFKAYSSDLSN